MAKLSARWLSITDVYVMYKTQITPAKALHYGVAAVTELFGLEFWSKLIQWNTGVFGTQSA